MKSLVYVFALSLGLSSCPGLCSSYTHPGLTDAAVSGQPIDSGTGAPSPAIESVMIPGPLRSFLRMAGISQKIQQDDVLPLLTRNVYMQGYASGHATEFLLLLDRYLMQARELQVLAGSANTLRFASCDDAGTLIQILGYRLRQACGKKDNYLETANPERAFLTIDSGFPLTDVEEALQNGTPFSYNYAPASVPVIFHQSDWIQLSTVRRRGTGGLVDTFLADPQVARLYWAFSRIDAETRNFLQQSPGLQRLMPMASVLDFYGTQIRIRAGQALVPGEASRPGWKDLVGVNPDSAGEFVARLLSKDSGWLAVYFDVLSRVDRSQQAMLTEPGRLKRLYDAYRGSEIEPSATRGVFRKGPDLLALFTRVQWEPNGTPHVPGDLNVWKEILRQKNDSKIVHDWSKRAQNWDRPEQLLEAMTAFARVETDTGPLQMYLTMSQFDHGRGSGKQLSAETVRLLASRFSVFNTWYVSFAEFPELSDSSISKFVTTANGIDAIHNQTLRGNALGAFQANLGLWQILVRQGEVPKAQLDSSWQKVVDPFATVGNATQLFDASRRSLVEVLQAANLKESGAQDGIVESLAGPRQDSQDGQQVHSEIAGRLRSVLEDQRLVSLDTLFALSDGLKEMEQGRKSGEGMTALASELREFEMPRPIFTKSEKINWAPQIFSSHHAELQIKTDLTKVLKGPSTPAQLETARGQLMPFLRDTLVGLNYAYYEPPGAQILHNDPLFVRSHDFLGLSILSTGPYWHAPMMLGAGTPAGGGAYLMGSLADLSYALATTEQDFIAPENIQALVWKELIPELLVSGTLPRWWNVGPHEMHAVALYQRSGEELLEAAAHDPAVARKVSTVLFDRVEPRRLEALQRSFTIESGKAGTPEGRKAGMPSMMPADTFYLAAEFRRRFPGEATGIANLELEALAKQYPDETDWQKVSRDFGVPHPTLARSYARELLNVRPLPFFGGYSSRMFSESWESSNLYWARLADEMGYAPVMLNRIVPELTRQMNAKIFATDFEDWPAMLRAMQETGAEFRKSKAKGVAVASTQP